MKIQLLNQKSLSLLSVSLIICISLFSSPATSVPSITNVSASPVQALKFEKFEISFSIPSTAFVNPYDPADIVVFAEFWSPSGKYYKQNAFYMENMSRTISLVPGTMQNPIWPSDPADDLYEHITSANSSAWKVRFACPESGAWNYQITAQNAVATIRYPSNSTQSFYCNTSSNHGFVQKANNRYLKFSDNTPFYPIGTNMVTWEDKVRHTTNLYHAPNELGTNYFDEVFKEMNINGINYCRVFLMNIGQTGIIGKDFVGFNSNTIYLQYYNQYNSFQIDRIFDLAQQYNIYIAAVLFDHTMFGDGDYASCSWSQTNPFNQNAIYQVTSPNIQGTCTIPYQIFTQTAAKTLQKNTLRYFMARWGYSTQIASYELWNETDRIDYLNEQNYCNANYWIDPLTYITQLNSGIQSWHYEISNYIKSNDPNKHLITTSYANSNHVTTPYVFAQVDYPQRHAYFDCIVSQTSNIDNIYNIVSDERNKYYQPVMIGEYYYLAGNNSNGHWGYNFMIQNDPFWYDLHGINWASFLSGGSGTACVWDHWYARTGNNTLINYAGISQFTKQLPQLNEGDIPDKKYSISNTARIIYLKNNNNSSFYGWLQDVNYDFVSLIQNYPSYLQTLNNSQAPALQSSYTVRLEIIKSGTYDVTLYNTETGTIISSNQINSTIVSSVPVLDITINGNILSSKYGDIAFIVKASCTPNQWNSLALSQSINVRSKSPTVADQGSVFYIGTDHKIYQQWWTGAYWNSVYLNPNAPANVHTSSDLISDNFDNIIFTGTDNRIHRMYWNGSGWSEGALLSTAPQNVRSGSALCADASGNIYFTATDHKLHRMKRVNASTWSEEIITSTTNANSPIIFTESDLTVDTYNRVFYVTSSDKKIHYMQETSSGIWQNDIAISATIPRLRLISSFLFAANCSFAVDPVTNSLYYPGNDNKMHRVFNIGSNNWTDQILNSSAPQNIRGLIGDNRNTLVADSYGNKIFYIAIDNRIHELYFYSGVWYETIHNSNDPQNVNSGLSEYNGVYYAGTDARIWSSYWGCDPSFHYPRLHSSETTQTDITSEINIQPKTETIELYPNPADENITISMKNLALFDTGQLEIYNQNGQLISSSTLTSSIHQIDLSGLCSGLYIVIVKIDDGRIYNSKFIRQ